MAASSSIMGRMCIIDIIVTPSRFSQWINISIVANGTPTQGIEKGGWRFPTACFVPCCVSVYRERLFPALQMLSNPKNRFRYPSAEEF